MRWLSVLLALTTEASIPITGRSFTLGGRNGGEWLRFNGTNDEVALYDHALSDVQIENHRRVALGL